MSTITKEFTKEQLIEWAQKHKKRAEEYLVAVPNDEYGLKDLALARIALASLEAEPVGCDACGGNGSVDIDHGEMGIEHIECPKCYTAPPAPVSVPDEDLLHMAASAIDDLLSNKDRSGAGVWAEIPAKLRRAAMLQGAEPVTTAYKLPEDFDFDRFNDVVWLEAVANNPHMHSLTTSTIAMVALELNKRLEAGNSPVVLDGACPCCGRKQLKNRTCSVSGCDGKHVAHGFCKKHYDIELKKDPSRRESIRAADKRYRARKAAAPQQEA